MPLEHGVHHGWHSRGYLPHFDMPGLHQFVTFRLIDSLPIEVYKRLHASAKAGSDEFHDELDGLLDKQYGCCILQRPDCAGVVEKALLHFDGIRYNMLSWVVMPNHVHAMFRVEPGHSLSVLLKSWKAFSAAQINKLLGQTGSLWQPDYFDRMIRDEDHFYKTLRYIEENPVKAGLSRLPEEWRFSSAFARRQHLV
jgi:putative transposase